MPLYDIDGNTISVSSGSGGTDREIAVASVNIEYGRYEGTSYYLARIPKYAVNGKRITPKVSMTTPNGISTSGTKVSPWTFAKREKTVFCVNAGLFKLSGVTPDGQVIINGVSIVNTPMTSDNGAAISDYECYPLCIDADGNFSSPYSRNVDTADMISNGVVHAVTAWGQFVDSYALSDPTKFTEQVHIGKYVRQCIGQYQNGDYFVCTTDAKKGTITENEAGLTYEELAALLITKGAKFAYALDGGGSTLSVLGDRPVSPVLENETGRVVPTVIYFSVDD